MPQTNDFQIELIEEDALEISIYSEDVIVIDILSEDVLEFDIETGGYIYVDDYNPLRNHPYINGEELIGDKTFEQLGREDIRNARIKNIIDEQYEAIFGGN